MGDTRTPQFVTPLVAMLAADPRHFESAKEPLQEMFGPLLLESPLYPFDKTEYYTPTMGSGLQRKFFAFEKLSDPGLVVQWKLACNELELKFARTLRVEGGPPRPINLDPGYIAAAKLVLASTKDFAHRIYMRDGIFAELTLRWRGDRWVGHEFTFPDYKDGTYEKFFCDVRVRHLAMR